MTVGAALADGTVLAANASANASRCGFWSPDRRAAAGNLTIAVRFDWAITLKNWTGANPAQEGAIGAVEVHRGPLAFALRPASARPSHRRERLGVVRRALAALAPNASWAYALDPGPTPRPPTPRRAARRVRDRRRRARRARASGVPFGADARRPCACARGRVVDAWGPPAAAARRRRPTRRSLGQPLEELVLVPFGATNLRVAVFPVLDGAGRTTQRRAAAPRAGRAPDARPRGAARARAASPAPAQARLLNERLVAA